MSLNIKSMSAAGAAVPHQLARGCEALEMVEQRFGIRRAGADVFVGAIAEEVVGAHEPRTLATSCQPSNPMVRGRSQRQVG